MNEQFSAYLNTEKSNTIERYRHINKFAQKGQILFAGSSLAQQFPIDELIKSIDVNTLPSKINIYNRGVGGFVIDDLLNNIHTLILDLKPSKLFINIGTNDIGQSDYLEQILMDKYQELLNIVKETLPNCEIYILSYYPINYKKKSGIPENQKPFVFGLRNNQSIINANEALVDLAHNNNGTYIDVSSCLMDTNGDLKEYYTIEGIHLWPNAYKQILDILVPYFS